MKSVQFSCSVMSDSFRPHEPQHARPSCPSPTPRACSISRPSSWRCHPTISSSVIPFSSYLQSFPASGCLPMSQFFASGGPSIGASASASVLPMNIQDWSPLGWTGWISLQSKGLWRVFSNITVQSINSSALSFLYGPTLTSIHDHWNTQGQMALTAPPSSFPFSWIHKASKALPLGSIFWPLNHEVLSCLRSDATYYFNSIQPKVTYLLLCSRQVKMTVTPSYPVGDLEGIQEFIRSLIVH